MTKKFAAIFLIIIFISSAFPVQAIEIGRDKGQHVLFFASWFILEYYLLRRGFNVDKDTSYKVSIFSALAAGITKELYDIIVAEKRDSDFWLDTSLDLAANGLGVGLGVLLVMPFD